jgi:hypothetical protein
MMADRVDSPAMYASKGDPNNDVHNASTATFADQAKDVQEIVRSKCKRYQECRNHKWIMNRPADQRRFAMLYGDQHWDSSTYEEWQSTPTINMVFSAINSILPIITDNRPQISVIPREPEDDAIANVIGKVIEWLWEYCNCDILLPKTMLNALIFGNGFWKIMWDSSARQGLGDITVKNIDPTNMFFNPEATSIDDATEMYHVEQMPLSWIRATYPEKADMVKAGVEDGTILVNRPHQPQKVKGRGEPVEVRATTGQSYTYPSGSQSNTENAPPQSATVMEAWTRNPETGMWRKTVVANKVLLEDEEVDWIDTPPFIHFVDYPVPWTIWATGEVQHVESLQYEINRRRGMILDILRHCAMPMMVVDPAAGVDHESIKAKPNLVIPAEGGPAAVGILAPQMDLGGLFGVNDRDKDDFNTVLGNVEINQGKNPTGVEAGVALEILAEAANTRLRLKVRLMESSLRRGGHIFLKFIQKFYTGQRIFRIVGGDSEPATLQQPAQFFSINQPVGMQQPPMGPDGMPQMDPETGQPMQGQPLFDETSNQIPQDAEFDIRIGAGSTLPVSKTARFQQAITLFDRGAIDQQELLKSASWPKWEQVLARMQQQQMAMMMAQQGVAPEGVQVPGSAEELVGESPPEQEAA